MPNDRLPLFDPSIVDDLVNSSTRPTDTDVIIDDLRPWVESGTLSNLGELTLEQAFNNDIFGSILDYRLARPGRDEFQFLPKQQAQGGSGFPDFLIGYFEQDDSGELDEDTRIAVGELKGPGTNLDSAQRGGEDIQSPVEQAFDYSKTSGLSLRWVIVSNMEEIRLYHHGSINHYEKWELEDFIDDDELTDKFWRFYFLMHRDTLLGEKGQESRLEQIFERDLSARLELTEDFYEFYRDAVEDVYEELAEDFPEKADNEAGRIELIQASQKLMHRAIFICIFSDKGLLPPNLMENILETGQTLPTLRENKIYPLLRDLFRCIDMGSPDDYPHDIYGYDGGLFEPDGILEQAELPDDLFTQEYEVGHEDIDGVFGFHIFNFRDQLNEFVLGRIFEESIADFEQMHQSVLEGEDPFSEEEAREDLGIYFTREGLTEFVAEQVIEDILADKRERLRNTLDVDQPESEDITDSQEYLEAYLDEILDTRIVDLSCGSGAFLVSCFSRLQQEAEVVHDKLLGIAEGQTDLTFDPFDKKEKDIIERCIHGNDLLQEAVEISKLSVWIRSAEADKPLGMLTGNFTAQDGLAGEVVFENGGADLGFGDFDLVIGNPPWGGEITEDAEQWCREQFDDFDTEELDTYELFTLTGLRYLNENGRLAFVLPQTILRTEHRPIRQHLVENYTFERFHQMGADWFGSDIRMSTVTVQLKNDTPDPDSRMKSMTLVGETRRQAIEGSIALSQLEASTASDVPQQRCIDSGEIEPFRYTRDDELIQTIESNSIPVGGFCESSRGVELNRAGHIVQCPGCMKWMSPPRGSDPDDEKTCGNCDFTFERQEILSETFIVGDDPEDFDVPYISGDAQGERYDPPDLRGLDLGYDVIDYNNNSVYKNPSLYEGEAVYVREAGVGVSASYFSDAVYCPRSVYVLTVRDPREEVVESYDAESGRWAGSEMVPSSVGDDRYHRFLLAVLNSRIMHYYVFKRFSSVDSAEAFANLRLTDVRSLPVPVGGLSTEDGQEMLDEIVECVDALLTGEEEIGGTADLEIERLLSELYRLSAEDMAYLHTQMGLVGYQQAVQQLYPEEQPSPPERKETISMVTADD